jgi:S-DNA-T family DNA segregation ATPase FtsK/SpoIIIE
VLGVAFFGFPISRVISLASYSAQDPVLFFSTAAGRPGNFGGRVGALLAELAFQVLGYGAYLLPAALVVVGWHYFWVRALTAPWTKLAGGVLLFSAGGAALAIAFVKLPIGGKAFPAGGALGAGLAGLLTEQLNRSGALVLVLTALFLSLLMVTQLSFQRSARSRSPRCTRARTSCASRSTRTLVRSARRPPRTPSRPSATRTSASTSRRARHRRPSRRR